MEEDRGMVDFMIKLDFFRICGWFDFKLNLLIFLVCFFDVVNF